MSRTAFVAYRGTVDQLMEAPRTERGDGTTEFFDLTEEERQLHYAHAADCVREVAHQAAVEYNARQPDLHSALNYRTWSGMGLVCALIVKHRDKPASIEVSRDGGTTGHIHLPRSKIIVQADSVGELLVVLIPKWLTTRLREDKRANLLGPAPELCADRQWTSADREAWGRLDRVASHTNTKIATARYRRPTGTRNTYA